MFYIINFKVKYLFKILQFNTFSEIEKRVLYLCWSIKTDLAKRREYLTWPTGLHPNPLGIEQTIVCSCRSAREPLKELRGWGVRMMGSGEEFPSGVGQSPRFCFCHVKCGSAKPKSVADPYWFWCVSVKIRIGLHQLTQFRRLARLIVSINLGEVVALYVVLYLI